MKEYEFSFKFRNPPTLAKICVSIDDKTTDKQFWIYPYYQSVDAMKIFLLSKNEYVVCCNCNSDTIIWMFDILHIKQGSGEIEYYDYKIKGN